MENSIWNIPIDECPIDEFLFVCLIIQSAQHFWTHAMFSVNERPLHCGPELPAASARTGAGSGVNILRRMELSCIEK